MIIIESLERQAEQIADTFRAASEQPPEKRIPDCSKLSYAEIGLALRLSTEGYTQTSIAQNLGCDQSTISRLLKEFSDTRPLAKLKAHNSALRLTERVIEQADVDQSLEVLDRIGVIEKRQVDAGRSSVNIVIGMPGQPAGPDVVIDVSPVPFAPQCAETGQSK